MNIYYIKQKLAIIDLTEVRYAYVYKSSYSTNMSYCLCIYFKNVRDDYLSVYYETEKEAVKELKAIFETMYKINCQAKYDNYLI